jgi:cation transport regulator
LIPDDKLTDLPDSVRNNLPEHAREVYRAAYNSAEEQYGEEACAHRVAWSTVEKEYQKNEQELGRERGLVSTLRLIATRRVVCSH